MFCFAVHKSAKIFIKDTILIAFILYLLATIPNVFQIPLRYVNGVHVLIFKSKQINTNIIFYFNFVIRFHSNRKLYSFKIKLLNKLFLNI